MFNDHINVHVSVYTGSKKDVIELMSITKSKIFIVLKSSIT